MGGCKRRSNAFERALRLNPQHADARCNLGNALRHLGQLSGAADCFRAVLATCPSHYQVPHQSRPAPPGSEELAGCGGPFPACHPNRPARSPCLFSRWLRLAEQGDAAAAISCFERACDLHPDFVEAYYHLGKTLVEAGRPADGLAPLQHACRLRPGSPELQNAVGVALAELYQFDAALPHFQEAIRLYPKFASALANQGDALRRCGRLEDAVSSLRRSLALVDNDPGAHHNLALALADQGDFANSLAEHERAIQLQPANPLFHKNRALLWLRLGEWGKGFSEFEWRWQCREFPKRHFAQPRWDGSPLDGKTVLLYAEQGLGDVLHFVRYADLLKQKGATVLVQCPAVLHPILSRCPGIDRLLAPGSSPAAFDVHAALMSLPGIMATSVAGVPAIGPYVFADPELVARWKRELSGLNGLRVGVCWQGSRDHSGDRQRSFPLAELAPLAQLPNVSLVSLQVGAGKEQIASCRGKFPIVDFGERVDRDAGAFMDTAAIIKNVDLVISCDTAIGHLAGALGAPVWLALSTVSDWRWLLDRSDTPWYPSMRLFRQKEFGNWRDVFDAMARELLPRSSQV